MKPTRYSSPWSLLLGTLALLLTGFAGRAQTQPEPYGNEWIVPSQTYYKVQTAYDGLFHLDYAYLTKAGLGAGTDLSRLQLWRRGKELAINILGNTATLDPSSVVEFFGQYNDGALDRGMYRQASFQAQPYYSLFTDSAAYFLTVGAAPGKRMAAAAAAPAPPVAYWMKSILRLPMYDYQDIDSTHFVLQSWADANEGFFSGRIRTGTSTEFPIDSVVRMAATGPAPQVDLRLVGGSRTPHAANVYILQPQDNTWRLLGATTFDAFRYTDVRYPVRRSDIGANRRLVLRVEATGTQTVLGDYDNVRVAYYRVTYPQTAVWPVGSTATLISNDTTADNAAAYYALNSAPAGLRGFDVTDVYNAQRVDGGAAGGARAFSFPGSAARTRRYLLADIDKAAVPPPARRIRFRDLAPKAANFLIVSSPVLMHPAGDLANPVRAYADYRASAAGGKYDTLVVTNQELFDQFHYGEKSALAIRHFTLFMLTDQSREKCLLLLGKGYQTGEKGFFTRQHFELDLVTASTRACSDYFFSADWAHNKYVSGLLTGRVAARTPEHVAAYLSKLKEHEALGAEPWRLNALNLSGGEDPDQFAQFRGYVDTYKAEIESPCFQGKVVKTYTKAAQGTLYSFPININIAKELNAGLSLISYFGHGSYYNLDLNIGYINDPVNGYTNKGKYPVMFYNGCVAGNAFADALTIGEDWTLAADKGAIGFMCQSGFGFDGVLHRAQTLMYQVLLNEPAWFGKPITAAWQEVARRLQPTRGDDPYISSTLMNTVWQGDPALRLFAPAKPDLVITNDSLQLQAADNEPILASTPSFKLVVRAGNLGNGCGVDTVSLCVTRQYPTTAGRPDDTYTFALPMPQRTTTFTVDIPNTGNVFGENTFTVKLDCDNKIDELNEQNNTGQLKYNFLQGGVSALSPPEFAIVPTPAVHLVGQLNITGPDTRSFAMELDTVPTFNSGLLQRTTTTGRLLAEWRPALPALAGRDSVVWYWRLRLQTPQAGENDAWATSSFRVIKGTEGWSQSHYGQFQRDARQRLDVAAPAGRWEFGDAPRPITLRTQGANAGNTFQSTFGIIFDGNTPFVYNCFIDQPGMLVAVYDGRTLRPVRTVAGVYDSCGLAPTSYYRFDGINNPARQAQLLQLLQNVPAGDYVALVSVNKVNFTSFSTELKAAFADLGSRLIATLQDGDPLAFVGQKGPDAHPVQEQTYDPNGAGGRYEQVVALSGTLRARGGSGVITSTLIGPARQWTTLFHTVRPTATGSYALRVLGVDANGKATELNPDVKSRDFSLAGVSAQQYPYLQLQLQLRDTLNGLAPQLRQWLVTYQGVPEGVVRPDLAAADAYAAATLTKQAAGGYITVPVKFENVSGLDFGTPLKAEITLRDAANRTSTTLVEYKGGVLKAGETATIDATASVINLASGVVTGSVNVNPRLLPEQYYYNNELVLPPFTVTNNSAPPVLDVAFDGQHILNGDIVSPAPVVTVQLQNNNLLRPIKDPNSFSVFLLRPGATTPEQINVTSSAVVFSADSAKGTARIEYRPGKTAQLADGVYTLIAQGRDAAGTVAGTQEYRVQFEVITASTITHLYPYPNPVTSKTRFVFTLTGAEMPRNLKIQILSLTGRVVREIMMAELGPLHIGNNITDYAWDGTDEYGDRLANGTYLYRVVMDDPGSQFARRATAGDKAFKKDWGKLVLLR